MIRQSSLEYLIGITLPLELDTTVRNFQRQYVKQVHMEPHITVKAQPGLNTSLSWLPYIRSICQATQSFQITFGAINFFTNETLYLSVHSQSLISLHQQISNRLTPNDRLRSAYFEMDSYIPHMTIASARTNSTGVSQNNLLAIAKEAEVVFSDITSFNVIALRIYEFNSESGEISVLEDIPLRQYDH